MKKMIYIASLNTEREKYDGERIKSSFIYQCLINKFDNVILINLSLNRLFQTFKLFFKAFFLKKKIDYFIISKDPRGATIVEKILFFLRVPQDKIYYFEIGPFLYDFSISGRINKKWFIKNKKLIVETKGMKNDLESIGFKNVDVFPNFKRKPNLKIQPKFYPKKVLSLIYLSRIEEQKGIYDVIDSLKALNKTDTLFSLDVYGMFVNEEERNKFFKKIEGINYIHYCGELNMMNDDGYQRIKDYDLHIFPTHYGEGFPGSLIDFFFLQIPTVSASFARSVDILDETDSFIYEQGSVEKLTLVLLNIYNNQHSIAEKANQLMDKSKIFTLENFENYLETLFNEE